MNLKRFWIPAVAGLAFLSACAQEVSQPEAEDAWEVPEVSAPSADAPGAAASPAPAADPNLLVVLKGSDFKGETTTSSVHGDILRVGHYFAAEAPFELETTATLLETQLTGTEKEGAVPLIGITIVTTEGKYNSIKLQERPIDGEQLLRDPIDLGPGKYKMVITYYKDTVGAKRPHITVHKAELRKSAE